MLVMLVGRQKRQCSTVAGENRVEAIEAGRRKVSVLCPHSEIELHAWQTRVGINVI